MLTGLLDNPKFILLDEGDFFRKGEQEDVSHVSERYIAKSDPYIVMVSTPNLPGGLFEKIENEPEETCIYKRIFLDYTYGLNKIYTQEEIEKAKSSPSFEREYNLSYGYGTGNIFTIEQIDEIIKAGQELNFQDFPTTDEGVYMGIDPGYGSSKFGIVVTDWIAEEGKIRVIYSEEIERAEPESVKQLAFSLYKKYRCNRILVDASGPGFIKSLKASNRRKSRLS